MNRTMLVSSVGIGRRYNATNNVTGETFADLTFTQLTKIIRKATAAARAEGLDVDEFGRINNTPNNNEGTNNS